MDQHQKNVNLWRDYFLQHHHVAFIRNDPDGPTESQGTVFSSSSVSSSPSPDSSGSDTSNEENLNATVDGDFFQSTLSDKKSAIELLLADQRKTLHQSYHQEMLRMDERWQAQVSRKVEHIQQLLAENHQLEETISHQKKTIRR